MVVAAEMWTDEEARKGLEFMLTTVNSGDDVLSWIDYLALPAGDWDGEEIPEVDPFNDAAAVSQNLPFGLEFEEAHAATVKLARVSSRVLGGALAKISKQVSRVEAKAMPGALKNIRAELTRLESKDFRKFVHSPGAMKGGAWLMFKGGARSVRNFVRGKSNARYSTPMIIATTAYLAWEASCGLVHDLAKAQAESGEPLPEGEQPLSTADLNCGNNVTLFNEQVRGQLAKKFAIVFADSATGRLDEEPSGGSMTRVTAAGHGALFHLVQTAAFQLQHRLAGGPPIKQLEASRWVGLFQAKRDIPLLNQPLSCGKNGNGCYQRLRYVDILLGKEGVDEPETWVELKSWAAQSLGNDDKRYKLVEEAKRGDFQRWDFTKTGKATSLHRQFYLDRAASTLTTSWLTKRESDADSIRVQQAVGDFKWLFQAFKEFDKGKKSATPDLVSPKLGSSTTKGSLRELVSKPPTGKGADTSEASFISTNFGRDASVGNKMQLTTGATLISNLMKQGFEEAAQAVASDIDID